MAAQEDRIAWACREWAGARLAEAHRAVRAGRNRAQRGIVGCDTVKQDTSFRRVCEKSV